MPPFGGEDGWPEVDDLRRRLNVQDESVHEDEMAVILAAAITQIKAERGNWDEETDEPNENLAEAALDRAVELASDIPIPRDQRRSNQLMQGQRERFPIA